MGNVLESFESHQTSPTATADTKSSVFTYDKRGRVLKETTTVNGSADYAIVEYAYDDLGKLKTKTYGIGDNAVTETYDYNIRGWLTEKKSDVFDMRLRYHDPQKPGTAASYTGNISEWEWQHKGNGMWANSIDNAAYTYAFAYDKLSRLTDSGLFKDGVLKNDYGERNLSYDRNGNILTLSRTDDGRTSDYSGEYIGNQLMSIDGYQAQYEYDSNGNRTFDIETALKFNYNLLNLTSKIYLPGDNSDESSLKFRWLADGTKAAFSLYEGYAGFEYLGSLKYLRIDGSTVLQDASFGGGWIMASETGSGVVYTPNYYITDHLGSTRAIVAGGMTDAVLNYYPFGEKWGSWGIETGSNTHYFNGKEEVLTGLDYGARVYSNHSGIPTWTTPDPLAEKYFSWSPYSFCGGNPVNRIDFNGMEWYSYWQYDEDEDGNQTGGRRQYEYREGAAEKGLMEKSQFKFEGLTYATRDSYYSLNGVIYDMKNDLQNGEAAILNDLDALWLRSLDAYPSSSSSYGRSLNPGKIMSFAGKSSATVMLAGVGNGLKDASVMISGMQAESRALGLGLDYGPEIAKIGKYAKWAKAIGIVGTAASYGYTEYLYNSGQISQYERIIEHMSTTISAFPEYGAAWAIGWELGKSYGPSKW